MDDILYFYYIAFVRVTNGTPHIRKEDWLVSDPCGRLYVHENIDIVGTAPGRSPEDGEYRIRAEGRFDFTANDDGMQVTAVVTKHVWEETPSNIVRSFANPQPQRPIFFDVAYDYPSPI